MRKNPKVDLRYQYRHTLEASAAVALLLLIVLMNAFKKFDVEVRVRAVDAPTIKVEDIPITRTVKKIEVPRKPTIPIPDPDIDEMDNIDIPDINIFDPKIAPPPPPPAIEDEIVPFYKVERPPVLIGGQQAIADYIRRHDLFPKVARDAGVSGMVIILFVVNRDGNTTDVKVFQERPPGLGFGEAGVEVMKHMHFKPGMQRDKLVSVQMKQTISFTIE